MVYQATVNTPANTTIYAPVRTTLQVTKGLVYRFHLYMPHGAMGYHHVQVHDGSYQIWPTTPGEWFWGDGIEVSWEDIYFKSSEPFTFQIVTFNEDTTYDHRIIVDIGMVSEEAFMMRYLPGLTYDKMLTVLDRMQKAQEAAQQSVITQPFSWLIGPGE